MSDLAHGHRRSIRLPGWDFRQAGAYFVTVVTEGRGPLFDNPVLRMVAETLWQQIADHASHVALDAWVVMPNHLHGILAFVDPPPDFGVTRSDAQGLQAASLGAIVSNFKSVTAKRINAIRHTPGMKVWQRNYYEHILCTESDLQAIRKYILDNPAHWDEDEENPARLGHL